MTSRLALLLWMILPSAAFAWWDTFIATSRPVPLVQEIEVDGTADEQANGGRGGQAVLLKPGGLGLTTDVEVPPGVYELFVIARDPAGKVGTDFITLDVKEHATGQTRSWTMECAYREAYFAVGQLYFPAHAGGKYTLTIKLRQTSLLVDRLELRDALGGCARRAGKTKRMLTSDEELAQLRAATTAEINGEGARFAFGRKNSVTVQKDKLPEWWTGRSAGARQNRNDELWAKLPDWNAPIVDVSTTPWAEVLGRDNLGLLAEATIAYEKTGNVEFGWDGAVLLCATAEKFPALDYFAQAAMKGSNLRAELPFYFSLPAGKNVYRGWSGGVMESIARSYDRLFDFIKDNQAIANYVGTKIAWVKTPQDVIKLLDVHLLQHGLEACRRDVISGGDSAKALIPLVQGVNDISRDMLDRGIFSKIAMDMTFRGGIDDQAICGYSRDGVHYIGSVGYFSNDLEEIANLLHKYRLAGGDARYDLLDPKRYPQMLEAETTLAQCRVAGFRLLVGDAGDLRLGRDPQYVPSPSRVLGGAGIAALESGNNGVGLYFGIGRGHAHQDTLNIELFAHGYRAAPDLGGRHEGKLHGSPNMRWNKVHNLVEVDDRNFENSYAGSTVAATGWNTSFSPQPGAQFMEHAARATSHPDVSQYSRQTALVDVGEDSYVFDVFRVRGGKMHTYCFHGVPTEKLAINTTLAPSKDEYLRKHYEGTQQEGPTPAMLQADWASTGITTRLTLFGHEGDQTLVGNAYSEAYKYNFPFLYVRGQRAESVFPSIIEPFAGKPFITEKRQVSVTPVALEVKTSAGATDLLYASDKPAELATLEGQVKVNGKFAVISRDADGVRLVHLVAGTELNAGDITIKAERAGYEAKLTGVNYDERTFTVEPALPAMLRGAVVGIGKLHHAFKIANIHGKTVTHEKTARYYQSAIIATNDGIECEIEPAVFGCDTKFIDGTTVSNEQQDKFWKATIQESDRWMNIGYPGYRGSWPNHLTLADIPDANGDGRRTLQLIGSGKDKEAEGKTLVELEVTRVEGENFYFKLPVNEEYQRGGWQYAHRWLVDENGKQLLRSLYPGSSFRWILDGPADFTDADKDGKTKLSAYLFGPGDTLQVDAFVYVRRESAGVYAVRANVPCTVKLAGQEFNVAGGAATVRTK